MAARTISGMVEKGKKALRRKIPEMKSNYDKAKPQMKDRYGDLPFGPNTKASYNKGVDDAEFRTPDPDLWGKNFQEGVSR